VRPHRTDIRALTVQRYSQPLQFVHFLSEKQQKTAKSGQKLPFSAKNSKKPLKMMIYSLKDPISVQKAMFMMTPTCITQKGHKPMISHPIFQTFVTRQELLREMLVTRPEAKTQRPVSVSDIARRMGVSRNAISRLLNTDPCDLPLSEQMAVRCYLLTKGLGYMFSLADWLDIDGYYTQDQYDKRIDGYVKEYSPDIAGFTPTTTPATKEGAQA